MKRDSERIITLRQLIVAQILLSVTLCWSCEDFVVVDTPKNEVVSLTVFEQDATALAAMRGVYSQLISLPGFASGDQNSITTLTGLSSDEFNGYSNSHLTFESNALTPSTSDVKIHLWDQGYKLIYYSNSILEGLNNSSGLAETTRKQLEGESKFIRGFCHYYLASLFGDVPLVLTTDYRINNSISRTIVSEVYAQIINDLIDAQNLLVDDYSISNNERIRVNKSVARALLARVYLSTGDWVNAETNATALIDNPSYVLESNLDGVFLANSAETIWQLMPVISGYNTNEAIAYIPSNPNFTTPTVSISSSLLDAFRENDNRRIHWIDSATSITTGVTYYFPSKYKVNHVGQPLTEYYMVFRLAEQYLIRAEARARLDKLTEAIEDVDIIRKRSGLSIIADTNPSVAKEELLLLIEDEKRLEFFAEWGHRWLDLKRTGRLNIVMEDYKSNWNPAHALYPIPQTDRQNNRNLSQNPGY